MDAFLLLYWASAVTVLGWSYAAWASLWPFIFHRQAVKHSRPIESGFQIGRAVYWRLPPRAGWIVGTLSALMIPAALWLPNWAAVPILLLSSLLIVAGWVLIPPGTRLVFTAVVQPGQALAFRLERSSQPGRAAVLFILIGVLPALTLGAGLASAVKWLMAR